MRTLGLGHLNASQQFTTRGHHGYTTSILRVCRRQSSQAFDHFLKRKNLSTSQWQTFLGTSLEGSRSSLELARSEEHTSELQSRFDLVCRLLLEKKNKFQSREN